MTLLAIDTASNFCAVCVLDAASKEVLAQNSEDIGKGHAERLLGLVDETVSQAGLAPDDLQKIAVSVGPGSFTGIRVGVAAARGLALALDLKAVGVTTLEAMAHDFAAQSKPTGPFAVTISGGRGQIFAQNFAADGTASKEPIVLASVDDAKTELSAAEQLIGNAAESVYADRWVEGFDRATGSIASFAHLGLTSLVDPKPLYLRAADAKVQEGFTLPRATQ